MSEDVAPPTPAVQAFPRPCGTDLPERIFEHDQIVTGEAVALKIKAASPALLIGAGLIDLLLAYSVFITTLALLARYGALQGDGGATYIILALATAVFILPAAVETLTRGRSLGKWLVGIRILRDDGGAIRFRHAITRSLVAMFEIYLTFGSVALISTVSNKRHKRLGDLLAGTYPVSLQEDGVLPPPLLMEPQLVPWAKRADVSRLSGDLAWRVRQFLNQSRTLSPEHRIRIGSMLTQEVMAFVNPPPPHGLHPERFLAAVLIIRRDAEYRKGAKSAHGLAQRMSTSLPYGLSPSVEAARRSSSPPSV